MLQNGLYPYFKPQATIVINIKVGEILNFRGEAIRLAPDFAIYFGRLGNGMRDACITHVTAFPVSAVPGA